MVKIVRKIRQGYRNLWNRLPGRYVTSGSVTYYGTSGKRVHKEFGIEIEDAINPVVRRYGLRDCQIAILDDPDSTGGHAEPNLAVIPSGNFFLLEDSPRTGNWVIAHELGHLVHQRISEEERRAAKIMHEYAVRTGDINVLKDSGFMRFDNAGHPWDNPGELYASAFALVNMDQDKAEWLLDFSSSHPDSRVLLENIFRLVRREPCQLPPYQVTYRPEDILLQEMAFADAEALPELIEEYERLKSQTPL